MCNYCRNSYYNTYQNKRNDEKSFLDHNITNHLKSSVELTPQFTLQKFKVINPVWIPDFLVIRVGSHNNENNITILVNLLERVS